MKQIYISQGNHADDTVQQVNDWLIDYHHRNYTIEDIQYSYHDGYAGVMIVYSELEPSSIPDRADSVLNS